MEADTTIIDNDSIKDMFIVNINDTNTTSINNTDDGDPFWMILMDRSQLVMTLIGVIANIGTFVTLIKNKQVSFVLILHCY